MTSRAPATVFAALALLFMAACGSDGDGSPGEPRISIVSPESPVTRSVNHVTVNGTFAGADDVDSGVRAVANGAATDCTIASGTFTCHVLTTGEGTNPIRVELVSRGGVVATDDTALTYERPAAAFDIDVRFYDHSFTETERRAFEAATAFWERIILGDLADVPFNAGEGETCAIQEIDPNATPEPAVNEVIDDILIFATTFTEDSNTIGLAGPCRTRTGRDDGMNFAGIMQFNTTYLDRLEASGQLQATIVHEMGHVLGFGTNWEDQWHDLLSYEPTNPDAGACIFANGFAPGGEPVFTGRHGIAAYDKIGGRGPVPVDASGTAGTSCGHWDKEVFGDELMTGSIELGDPRPTPISVVTIASLYDIGFMVDATQAEAFELPRPSSLESQAEELDVASREILLRPIGSVDPATGRPVPFDRPD